MSNAMHLPVVGAAPETEIARHLAKLAIYSAPLLVFFGFVFWGVDGAASVLFALALVVANFAASAAIMSVTAKISLAMLMGGALFGFLIRFGLIALAVILVKDQPWVELVPLGLTLIVTHLGLLFWELHYVSATLAYPGLKPSSKPAKKKD
jgi:hypothetical protein